MNWSNSAWLGTLALVTVSCGDDITPGAAQPYTLTTCVVSGEKLGSMGKPYVFVHDGQEVKLCCKNCLKSFHADPMMYLTKIVPPPPLPNEITPK